MKSATLLHHLLAFLLIVFVGIAFTLPQFQGKLLRPGDTTASVQKTQDITLHEEATGERSYWSNAMFGGMPQRLLVLGRDKNVLSPLASVSELFFSNPAGIFMRCMTCCFLALLLLRINPWFAALGAILFGLTTNYVVMLEAGHYNKIRVLAFVPLIMGSLVAIFRGRDFLGAAVLAAALSLSIYENHIQMVYYLAIFILPLGILLLVQEIRRSESVPWQKIGLIAGALALGALSNVAQLHSAQNVAKGTMRGAPILSESKSTMNTSSNVEGLDWDYAMQWSNSIPDLWSLLVPRFVGGGSGEEIPPSTELAKRMRQNGVQARPDGNYVASMYWGDMPFNGGPYYMGVVLFLLYVLSWFWLPRRLSIGFGIGILLCLVISMGRHAASINRPLFDLLPLFNKFRAPNSAIAVLPFFFILPGIMGLHRMLKEENWAETRKKLIMAAGISGGLYLIFLLLGPSLLSFTGPPDAQYPDEVKQLFIGDRKTLFRSDILRCLAFLAATIGALFMASKESLVRWMPAALVLISLADLWPINRRYLDADRYITNRQYESRFTPRPVDQQILQLEPNGRGYYRVLDLSINTFNSASTSYHHNTVGGYSPKKPQRFNDLIERYIAPGSQSILNMLNTKYIIQRDGQLQTNAGAYGNAWFVQNVQNVASPDEEINQIGQVNLRTTAVVLQDEFSEAMAGFQPKPVTGSISLSEYAPNRLVYQANPSEEALAVFSEVWTAEGWTATIDGEEQPIIRVNYDFRGLRIPAGNHTVVFEYRPKMHYAAISLVSSLLILGGLVLTIFLAYKEGRSQMALEPAEPAPKKKVTPTTARKKKKKKSKK